MNYITIGKFCQSFFPCKRCKLSTN